MGAFEEGSLLRAEMECLLQLCRLDRALGAKENERRVRGDDSALLRAQEIARILGRENVGAAVLADAPSKADDEAADGRVLKEQTELIDHEHPATVPAFDAGPEGLGKQEMYRRDHLVTQLAHSEYDDRGLQVNVGRGAEHLAKTAVDPALKDHRDARTARQTVCNITQHRLWRFLIGKADSTLYHPPFRPVERSANACAQVDSVRGRWAEPRFVTAVGRSQVQDV